MKIAYCIGSLNLGGISTVAFNLNSYLKSKNYDFDIITTHHKGNLFATALSNSFPVIDVSNNEPSLKNRILNLKSFLNKYDVVINNHSDELIYAFPLLKKSIIKISVQHNILKKSAIDLSFNKKYIDYYAGVSPSVSDVIRKYTPSIKRVIDLPNGVNKVSFLKKQKERKIKLLYVGRIDNYTKNIFITLKIASQFKILGIDFKYNIVGDGHDLGKLKNLVEEYKLEDYVSILGQRSNLQVGQLMCMSDFIFNISKWEGLPMTVLEAMSCGLIPILSDIKPHNYILGADLSKKLIVKNVNVNKLVKFIVDLKNDISMYEKISLDLIMRWEKMFSLEAFGSNYEKIFLKGKNVSVDCVENFNELSFPFHARFKLLSIYVFFQKFIRFSK